MIMYSTWFVFISSLSSLTTILGHIKLMDQKDSCLDTHNILRSQHIGTGKVSWDVGLAKQAQRWAVKMAHYGRLIPDRLNAHRYGENLAVYSGSKPPSCAEAVLDWYRGGQIIHYNPTMMVHGIQRVYDFTQIVWAATTQIGVGIAFDDVNKRTFFVAKYKPAGNYLGLYRQNVMPRILGKKIPTLSDLLGGMSMKVTTRPPQLATTPVKTLCKDTAPNCFGLLAHCNNPTVRMHCKFSCKLC